MRRRSREIQVFSLSALDLFASAMGTFILIAVILFPYYLKNETTVRQLTRQKAEIEALERRIAAADIGVPAADALAGRAARPPARAADPPARHRAGLDGQDRAGRARHIHAARARRSRLGHLADRGREAQAVISGTPQGGLEHDGGFTRVFGIPLRDGGVSASEPPASSPSKARQAA